VYVERHDVNKVEVSRIRRSESIDISVNVDDKMKGWKMESKGTRGFGDNVVSGVIQLDTQIISILAK